MGIVPHFPNLTAQDRVIHSPSWGAAAFGPIYLLAMRAYAHAVGLTFVIALFVTAQFYPGLRSLGWLRAAVLVAAWFASVVAGRRIAWRTRRWRDFGDFLACQREWDRWGKGALVVAAVLIALDRFLKTAAPPRGLRAREILDDALVVTFSGAGAVAAWWYIRRHRERLRLWQQLGLRSLAVALALVWTAGGFALFHTLYMPDAAELFLGGSIFLAGVIAAATAWQYGRHTARRLWWLRLMLRLLVLPAVVVTAGGALLVVTTLRLPVAAQAATLGIIMALGMIAVTWQPFGETLGPPGKPKAKWWVSPPLRAACTCGRRWMLSP